MNAEQISAEQWLNNLEQKAKAALADMNNTEAVVAFVIAADPIAVLRLVVIVRALAFSAARSKGLFDDPAYWIDTAYQQTEPRP